MTDSLDTSEDEAMPWVKPVQQVVGDEDAPAMTAEELILDPKKCQLLQNSKCLIEDVVGKPAPLGGVNIASLQRRIAELEEELAVSNKLLRHRDQLLQAIPECPAHGYGCVPHALGWIEEMKSSQQEDRKPLTRCAAGSDGDCFHKECPQLRDGEPAKSRRHCPLDNIKEQQ